jgi:hypothetical protein
MSRRWREAGGAEVEAGAPYGPPEEGRSPEEGR